MPTSPTPAAGAPKDGLSDTAKRVRDARDRALLDQYAASRNPAQRDALVERFLPLARSLAWRYAGRGEPMDDLVQVASEGLVKAIDRYDPERANAFSSYATPVILGTLRHYFRDATQRVHVPRGLQESIQEISGAIDAAEGELGHTPSTAELVDRTSLETGEVNEALQALSTRRPASIDATVRTEGDETGSPMSETIGVEEPGFDRVEASLAAQSVELDPQEREALRLRFEENLTQREIGLRIGTSQMQVSRLLRRSMNRLLIAVQGKAA
jgi:RNA polymerase sigma-B factor